MKAIFKSNKYSNSETDEILECKLVARQFKAEDSVFEICGVKLGGKDPVIIAGPCSVESEEQILESARLVKQHGAHLLRGGAFKPRTSPYSFQGLGEKGLEFLSKAKAMTGLGIVTEVLETTDVQMVAKHADIIQIGSRNMQNYSLLKAVGRTDRPVLLKRGMAATLHEFLMSAEYIMSEGNSQVILCERGIRTFVDHSRNTLDLNVIPAVKKLSHLPIIVDPSHGTGNREFVEPMSLAALAAGADGLIIEVHPFPDNSITDASQTVGPEHFSQLMRKVDHFTKWNRAA